MALAAAIARDQRGAMRILFCADPLAPRQPDSMFAREADAVRDLGLPFGLIDFESLVAGSPRAAVRRVPEAQGEIAVYRGWMIRPAVYLALHEALVARGVHLINDPAAYERAHHLPGWYLALAGDTPRSVWTTTGGVVAMDEIARILQPFGDRPLVLKDFVKSRKHEWAEACFIPSASDSAAVERVVRRFVELQGDDLEGGLVFRELVDLEPAGRHPKSGMPLAREQRIFCLDGAEIASARYWDEIAYASRVAPREWIAGLAARVQSRFFTMDIAEIRGGGFTVIEVGDGQVSALPEDADVRAFYQAIAARIP